MNKQDIKKYLFAVLLVVGVLGFSRTGHTTPIVVGTSPILWAFTGNETSSDGKQNLAYEAWDAAIGEPVRKITFDEEAVSGPTPLSVYQGGGLVSTSIGDFFGIKTGGDTGLFPLISAADNWVIAQSSANPFQGLSNVDNLLEPNVNLIQPGDSYALQVNFGEGLDLDAGTISNFGNVEAVGGFVSSLDTVSLEIFDSAGMSLGNISVTPDSLSPFFIGLVFPRDTQPKQEIIAMAQFTFSGESGFDGLVYTTVVDAPPGTPVPEPATLFLLGTGLLGLGIARRKRQRPGVRG